MSQKDSGVSSNTPSPAASPNIDVFQTIASSLVGSHNEKRRQSTDEEILQANPQQSLQMELMSQLNFFGMMNMPQMAMPELQRMLMENHMSFNPMLAHQQMIWHQMMMMQMQRAHHIEREQTVRKKKPVRDEKPLDLSRKSGSEDGEDVDIMKKIEAVNAGHQTEDKNMGCPIKRNYSQLDLNAAVNDIRNGKLGTRRASVVYGIPRSTLRNKIYKLEAAEDQGGTSIVFKRRRPGGQSNEQKKLADQVEREKRSVTKSRSSSVTPTTSPESGNSDWPIEEPANPIMNLDILSADNLWASGLWANLFNGQTNMTPEVMSCNSGRRKKSEDIPDWKRQRPKRGQYRKYDKNALDEAVQSVRRGEMSVHRAGSFFGVPHSTLEYKVKERNLMRKKKIEEKEEAEGSSSSKSPEQINPPLPETSVTQPMQTTQTEIAV